MIISQCSTKRKSWNVNQLAAFSQQAHEATAAGDTVRVREIEAEIDRLAGQLWGLTDAELREIQRSLAELR